MKDGGKKIKQAAILGVLFLALVIVGVMQFRGTATPVPPSKAAKNPPAGETNTANAATTTPPVNEEPSEITAGALSWVEAKRLPGIAEEVKMRNPFQSFIENPQADNDVKVASAENNATTSVVNNQLIIPDKNLGRLPVYNNDMAAPLPVTPLKVVPPFKLASINTDLTARINYALVELNGEYFTLRNGERIPGVDWVVKSIDPLYKKVVLIKKDSEPVVLRISGGND